MNWIGENITYLLQEPKFADGRLLENIVGAKEVNKAFFNEILKRSDLENFINTHSDGINMSLENRGENLPVGIRKRIALARSLMVNGKLFLFDEPTGGLDDNGKNCIYQLIDEVTKSKATMFVATSDEKIIEKANMIINLDIKPKPEIISNNN